MLIREVLSSARQRVPQRQRASWGEKPHSAQEEVNIVGSTRMPCHQERLRHSHGHTAQGNSVCNDEMSPHFQRSDVTPVEHPHVKQRGDALVCDMSYQWDVPQEAYDAFNLDILFRISKVVIQAQVVTATVLWHSRMACHMIHGTSALCYGYALPSTTTREGSAKERRCWHDREGQAKVDRYSRGETMVQYAFLDNPPRL